MKKETKKAPTIRFRGFTDDWEQRKLKDIADSYSGGTPSVGQKKYYEGNIPFIRSAEINSNSTELFLSEEGLKNSSAKIVAEGDILYALYGATSGEVGRSRLNGAINQAILAIQPHAEFDSEFIMQWLRKSKKAIISKYLQGGQGNLSGTIVTGLEINLPTYSEQKIIGEYFQHIDNLITLHQRKLDQLKTLKKYFLQNMFPAKGEKVPRIRFKGFTGDWEQRKVGEFYDFKNGLNKNKEFFGTGVPIVNFTDVFHNRGLTASQLEGRVTLEPNEIKNYRVKKGDIFFTRTSETIEEIGYPSVMLDTPENTVFSGFVLRGRCFSGNDPLDNLFKQYVFFTQSFRGEMKKKSSMTTRALTLGTSIKEMLFQFPSSKNEQHQIGKCITKFDDLITLHQRKLDQLQTMKKFMLQNLFI